MIPLQVPTPGSRSTEVAKILHYGDPKLDEEIIIPSYESSTRNIENINPLTIEDLSKILDQSTQQARLYTNPILINVDELNKVVADSRKAKVKTKKPPSTFDATKLLLLPPLSPPKVVIDAWEDIGKQE